MIMVHRDNQIYFTITRVIKLLDNITITRCNIIDELKTTVVMDDGLGV